MTMYAICLNDITIIAQSFTKRAYAGAKVVRNKQKAVFLYCYLTQSINQSINQSFYFNHFYKKAFMLEKRKKVTVSLEISVLANAKSAAETESMPFSTWLNREVKDLQARKQLAVSSSQPSANP